MNRIAACVCRDGRTEPRALIDAMMEGCAPAGGDDAAPSAPAAAADPGEQTFAAGPAAARLCRGVCDGGGGSLPDGSFALWIGAAPDLSGRLADLGRPDGETTAASFVALLRERGRDFPADLPGMLSVVVWDAPRGRLYAAGDRSGAFPLYFTAGDRWIAICSSLPPVRDLLDSLTIDFAAMSEYLFFDAVYGNGTLYEEIRRLRYGTWLEADAGTGELDTGRFFDYEALFDPGAYELSREFEAPVLLTGLLGEASRRVLAAGGAEGTGLLCGGGIDCSYLAGVMRETGLAPPIFCADLVAGSYGEGGTAAETATRLGLELHLAPLEQGEYYRLLLESYAHIGRPAAHPNTPRLASAAAVAARMGRRHLAIGAGSDLLFGGFSNVLPMARYLKLGRRLGILGSRVKRVLGAACRDRLALELDLRTRNAPAALGALGLGNLDRAAAAARIERAVAPIPGEDERALKALMLKNLCDYQQHLLNRRHEYASAAGVALHYPFLDLDVVRFAVNLAVSHCVSKGVSKRVVREAAEPYLGDLSKRGKWGGAVPYEWVRPLEGLLAGGFLEEAVGYDHELLGTAPGIDAKARWNLVDIELWGRICMLGEEPGELLETLRAKGGPAAGGGGA